MGGWQDARSTAPSVNRHRSPPVQRSYCHQWKPGSGGSPTVSLRFEHPVFHPMICYFKGLFACATSRATINVPPDLCYERFGTVFLCDSLPHASVWINEYYGYIAAGDSLAHSGPTRRERTSTRGISACGGRPRRVRFLGAYSTDVCHPVHGKVATQSTWSLPPNPHDSCHPVHVKAATWTTGRLPPTPGEACPLGAQRRWAVHCYSAVAPLVNLTCRFRMDSPCKVIL